MDFLVEYYGWNFPSPRSFTHTSLFHQPQAHLQKKAIEAIEAIEATKATEATKVTIKMNAGFLVLEIAQPKDLDAYRGVFHRFMAYKLGRQVTFTSKGRVRVDAFPRDCIFTNDELSSVVPMDICRWFCLLAYNKETP